MMYHPGCAMALASLRELRAADAPSLARRKGRELRALLRQDKWGGAPTVPVLLRVAHVQHRHVPRRHQTSEAAHHRRGAAKKNNNLKESVCT